MSSAADSMIGTAFGQRRIVDWSAVMGIGLAMCLTGFSKGVSREWLRRLILVLAIVNTILLVPLYLLRHLPEYGLVY
jgi:hypothetical protein